jgi:hypothetical protein
MKDKKKKPLWDMFHPFRIYIEVMVIIVGTVIFFGIIEPWLISFKSDFTVWMGILLPIFIYVPLTIWILRRAFLYAKKIVDNLK